jgi:hypothetical protein
MLLHRGLTIAGKEPGFLRDRECRAAAATSFILLVRQRPQTASAGDRKTLENYNTLVQQQAFHGRGQWLCCSLCKDLSAASNGRNLSNNREICVARTA